MAPQSTHTHTHTGAFLKAQGYHVHHGDRTDDHCHDRCHDLNQSVELTATSVRCVRCVRCREREREIQNFRDLTKWNYSTW